MSNREHVLGRLRALGFDATDADVLANHAPSASSPSRGSSAGKAEARSAT